MRSAVSIDNAFKMVGARFQQFGDRRSAPHAVRSAACQIFTTTRDGIPFLDEDVDYRISESKCLRKIQLMSA